MGNEPRIKDGDCKLCKVHDIVYRLRLTEETIYICGTCLDRVGYAFNLLENGVITNDSTTR